MQTGGRNTLSVPVRITWGHRSPSRTEFAVRLAGEGVKLDGAKGIGLEDDEGQADGVWRTRSGGGDVDGVELALTCPDTPVQPLEKIHSIWAALIAGSDADTARRLREDAAARPDTRRLTVRMDADGLRGFALTVDQLLRHRTFWVPSLDLLVTAGDAPASFDEHQRQLAAWHGKRILEQVAGEADSTYAQWTARWEDMGSPAYRHPSQPAPGHVVCLTWDSALPKFGIDRGAGVWPDYGNPDRFRLGFDFGELGPELARTWKGQHLTDGLPIIATAIERDGLRYDVEQFAFPLGGPPAQRQGDIAMVLLSKVKVTELAGKARTAAIPIRHRREHPAGEAMAAAPQSQDGGLALEGAGHILLAVQGEGLTVKSCEFHDASTKADDPKAPWAADGTVTLAVNLAAGQSRQFVVKLPSPAPATAEKAKLLALDYGEARLGTVKFWSDWLARGTQFRVPDQAVNDLFRANLWHALRLPRRHGADGTGVRIDLPYSNFAYDQRGTPWPVNQAVYVDYMIYALRGHTDVAWEELRAIYRGNQQADGHVGGYANWGVYTPSMVYTAARCFLLSQDRKGLDSVLPQTLKAADWCLGQVRAARTADGRAG